MSLQNSAGFINDGDTFSDIDLWLDCSCSDSWSTGHTESYSTVDAADDNDDYLDVFLKIGEKESSSSGIDDFYESSESGCSRALDLPPYHSTMQMRQVWSEVKVIPQIEADWNQSLRYVESIKRSYRREAIAKWLVKRQRRRWEKPAICEFRRKLAASRSRQKGKFVKSSNTFIPVTEFRSSDSV